MAFVKVLKLKQYIRQIPLVSLDLYISYISFNIYLSQLVRLEGKLDFEGNRDFQTLKGLTLVQLLGAGWVQKGV